MGYAGRADAAAIEAETPWANRDVPVTTFAQLTQTAGKFPDRPAVTFQLESGPKDPAETLTWSQLLDRTVQSANLFRSLGIREGDVVAFMLPNCTEAVLTYLGGQIAGIVNPINPLLEPEQIAAILRETGAKVLVTMKSFPKSDVAQKAAAAVALALAQRNISVKGHLAVAPMLGPFSSWPSQLAV